MIDPLALCRPLAIGQRVRVVCRYRRGEPGTVEDLNPPSESRHFTAACQLWVRMDSDGAEVCFIRREVVPIRATGGHPRRHRLVRVPVAPRP